MHVACYRIRRDDIRLDETRLDRATLRYITLHIYLLTRSNAKITNIILYNIKTIENKNVLSRYLH